jgi:hypothetical protein
MFNLITNNIWKRVQIIKFLIRHFPSPFCRFFLLRSEYSPQQGCTVAEMKGEIPAAIPDVIVQGAGKWMFSMKRFDILKLTNFKLLSQKKGNSTTVFTLLWTLSLHAPGVKIPGYVTASQQTVLTSNWASFTVYAKRFEIYFDIVLILSFFFNHCIKYMHVTLVEYNFKILEC